MKDSWCSPLHYQGNKIYGGAARNARIKHAGGMDEIIKNIATQAYNEATLAANRANGGNVFQMPKQVAELTA